MKEIDYGSSVVVIQDNERFYGTLVTRPTATKQYWTIRDPDGTDTIFSGSLRIELDENGVEAAMVRIDAKPPGIIDTIVILLLFILAIVTIIKVN